MRLTSPAFGDEAPLTLDIATTAHPPTDRYHSKEFSGDLLYIGVNNYIICEWPFVCGGYGDIFLQVGKCCVHTKSEPFRDHFQLS